jgi:hypothetical protein
MCSTSHADTTCPACSYESRPDTFDERAANSDTASDTTDADTPTPYLPPTKYDALRYNAGKIAYERALEANCIGINAYWDYGIVGHLDATLPVKHTGQNRHTRDYLLGASNSTPDNDFTSIIFDPDQFSPDQLATICDASSGPTYICCVDFVGTAGVCGDLAWIKEGNNVITRSDEFSPESAPLSPPTWLYPGGTVNTTCGDLSFARLNSEDGYSVYVAELVDHRLPTYETTPRPRDTRTFRKPATTWLTHVSSLFGNVLRLRNPFQVDDTFEVLGEIYDKMLPHKHSIASRMTNSNVTSQICDKVEADERLRHLRNCFHKRMHKLCDNTHVAVLMYANEKFTDDITEASVRSRASNDLLLLVEGNNGPPAPGVWFRRLAMGVGLAALTFIALNRARGPVCRAVERIPRNKYTSPVLNRLPALGHSFLRGKRYLAAAAVLATTAKVAVPVYNAFRSTTIGEHAAEAYNAGNWPRFRSLSGFGPITPKPLLTCGACAPIDAPHDPLIKVAVMAGGSPLTIELPVERTPRVHSLFLTNGSPVVSSGGAAALQASLRDRNSLLVDDGDQASIDASARSFAQPSAPSSPLHSSHSLSESGLRASKTVVSEEKHCRSSTTSTPGSSATTPSQTSPIRGTTSSACTPKLTKLSMNAMDGEPSSELSYQRRCTCRYSSSLGYVRQASGYKLFLGMFFSSLALGIILRTRRDTMQVH